MNFEKQCPSDILAENMEILLLRLELRCRAYCGSQDKCISAGICSFTLPIFRGCVFASSGR